MESLPILRSKKFIASALASVLAFLCQREGMGTHEVATIIGPFLAYVGMQGIADMGKEKAKVEADYKRDAAKPAAAKHGVES